MPRFERMRPKNAQTRHSHLDKPRADYALNRQKLLSSLERLSSEFTHECEVRERAGDSSWNIWETKEHGITDPVHRSCLTAWINDVMQSDIGTFEAGLEWETGFDQVLKDFIEKNAPQYLLRQHFGTHSFIVIERKDVH